MKIEKNKKVKRIIKNKKSEFALFRNTQYLKWIYHMNSLHHHDITY